VVSASPTDHWAHYLLGKLAAAQQDLAAARSHFAEAVRLQPKVALYARHLARITATEPSMPSRTAP